MRVEGGGALPISQPQQTLLGLGLGASAGASLELLPILDLSAELALLVLPTQAADFKDPGTALPLEDDKTAKGRESNRRAEFIITWCGEVEGQQ